MKQSQVNSDIEPFLGAFSIIRGFEMKPFSWRFVMYLYMEVP
ncbi:hypothetical protein [Paenibacillus foliorum]|nr:hypothetical protein [Paenibacillus foliorum]